MFTSRIEKQIVQKLSSVDRPTIRNIYHVSEYVEEIQAHMFATEDLHTAKYGYMQLK